MLRRLVAAPIPGSAVILGKMLAYTGLGCLQVIVLFAVARIAFKVPLGRSPAALLVLAVATAVVSTALGMFVATVSKTSKQADSLGTVLGFVLAGIGGVIPIHPNAKFFEMEGLMGVLSRLTPHGHAVDAFYRVMAEDASLGAVLPKVGILLAMGIVLFAIARWRFRFQQ